MRPTLACLSLAVVMVVYDMTTRLRTVPGTADNLTHMHEQRLVGVKQSLRYDT